MKARSIAMYGDRITIRTRVQTGTDAYGDPAWTVTSKTVRGVYSPTDTVENILTGGWQVIDRPNVMFPPTAVIDTSATVIVHGREFQVKGVPALWRNPFTNWEAGIKVYLQTTSG